MRADLKNNTCPLLPLSHTLQRANKGSKVIERLKKKLSEQESLLLLMSPNMAFRVHNRNGKVRAPSEPEILAACVCDCTCSCTARDLWPLLCPQSTSQAAATSPLLC